MTDSATDLLAFSLENADRKLIDEEHEALLDAVRAFDMRRLGDRPTSRGPTSRQLIVGGAADDTHYTGQIQLLKRMYAAQRRR